MRIALEVARSDNDNMWRSNDRRDLIISADIGRVPSRVWMAIELVLDGNPRMDLRMANWLRSSIRISDLVGKRTS